MITSVIGLGAVLVACTGTAPAGASDDPSSTVSRTAPPATESTEPAGDTVWEVTGVEGQTVVPGSSIVVTVVRGSLGVWAGCNHQGGLFTDHGDRWEVGEWGSDAMGCDEPLMEQDAWLQRFFTAGPSVTRNGAEITLTAGDVSLTLTERAPVELAGTTWQLTGLITDGRVNPLVLGGSDAPVMAIYISGAVELRGPCTDVTAQIDLGRGNPADDGGWTYPVTPGPTVTFEPGPACEFDGMDAHHLGGAVLDGEVTFKIEDRTLTVTAGNGQGLQFAAAG